MKFILFVEGYTEYYALPKFFKKWLDPQLINPVGVQAVRFDGWPELIKDAPIKAGMYLNGPAKDKVIAVISLLDLYGPSFYPSNIITSEDRYAWSKKAIESKVDQPKFYQFFAVHEVEAWLLSDPGIFPLGVKNAFPDKINNPETVNFNEPPAKLLERLYSSHTRHSYKKLVNGKDLFSRLDPDVAYQKCPKLKTLLDKMLELAKTT